MSERSREELERALAASERKAAELQAWADSSDAEAEGLRAQVAQLEARPPSAPASGGANAELQQWLDASEAEVEKLREQVAQLEARPPPPPASGGANAELQQWLDASEAEVEKLREQVAQLEARPPPPAASGGANAELQQWLDASEAEVEKLREQVAQLEARPPPAPASGGANAELQQWLDASEAEVEKLREQVAQLEARPPPPPASGGANAELQQWLDASEAEVEKLREQVAQLEARPPPPAASGGANAELQQWLDASEAEVEKLREQVAQLEARPPPPAASGGANAELQQWLDASEAEVEKLREQVAQLEARPPPPAASGGANAELQQWLDASEAEVEKLREQVAQLEARPPPASASAGAAAELQQWLDASEAEVEKLRAEVEALREASEQRAHAVEEKEHENEALRAHALDEEKHAKKDEKAAAELQQWLDSAEAENEKLNARLAQAEPELKRLTERVGELETTSASLREMNKRFLDQAEVSAKRDVERLRGELETAKKSGSTEKIDELAATLSNAREAIATLESERASAIAQVHRYASRDSEAASEFERKSKAELAAVSSEKDARIAVLQANLTRREEELRTVEARLGAYVASDEELKEDRERWRVRECEAREQLGHVRDEREQLDAKYKDLEHQLAIATTKLNETKQWLEKSEAAGEALEKSLEASRLEHAMRLTELKSANERIVALGKQASARAEAPEAEAEGTEGFSLARLHRLESLLATEQQRADSLQGLVRLADKTVAKMRDELEASHGKLCDLLKKLGFSGAEFEETLASLQGTRRELQALKQELSQSLAAPVPPPPPLDAFDDAPPPVQEDVVSAPLDAMNALADAQAQAAKDATEALKGEQKAREQSLNDLTWLKAEIEKLAHARDDLRGRLAEMVQREVKRKGVVASLLARLREGEVATASRLGAVRRLQAAIELAQRTAVKVQTIYFQKQIGSLQRQLEAALGKKRPAAAPLKTTVVPMVSRGR